MTDRLRIDRIEAERAPAEAQFRQPAPRGPADGAVFGHVGTAATPVGTAGIWSKPKFVFAAAGVLAALCGWALVDGIGGFWWYEARDRDPPVWVVILFLPAFCALLAALIAAADDLAAGAFGRGALFGLLGLVGGAIGGLIAQFAGGILMGILVQVIIEGSGAPTSQSELLVVSMVARVPAWTMCGVLAGIAVGALGRSLRRMLLGMLGGAIGGFVGGLVFDPLSMLLMNAFELEHAAGSRLIGLATVGGVTGFAIAFAEDAAKSAWLVIERGRLIGKQFIIYRNPTRIGAAYSNDVFLFKDPSVSPEHAHISRRGGSFQVEARGDALVRVNGRPVASARIANNDVIQIGETLLRFMTKQGQG